MAKKKTVSSTHKMIDSSTENLMTSPASTPSYGFIDRVRSRPKVLVGVIILLAVSAFFLANKGLLVAAVVNGKPIWRWDLNTILTARYGKQTLEGMISEKLIADAANKASVAVSPAEIVQKEQEVVRGLGENVNIDDLLKYQGVSRKEFDDQIKLQLTVQKILGKDIQITDGDISNFIATNRATLVATEEGALRVEAKQVILETKIGEKVQPWFTTLKDKAKILRFL